MPPLPQDVDWFMPAAQQRSPKDGQTEMRGAQALPVSGTALPGGAWTAAAGLDWQGRGAWRLKLAWLGVHGHHYHSNDGTVLLQYVW
ncbi:hypothetical protein [Metallibacterium sp.]|uniref:hypothetical protein n=2 Tax=Metallibacterium sp. TaxID=2940281 RepID=UPI002622AE76|nr:hypothetical protein [Metallibacterium sp.]